MQILKFKYLQICTKYRVWVNVLSYMPPLFTAHTVKPGKVQMEQKHEAEFTELEAENISILMEEKTKTHIQYQNYSAGYHNTFVCSFNL